MKFTVQVRAIQHLTRELELVAANAEEARRIAEWQAETGAVVWEESEPEDFQVESVTRMPGFFEQLPSARGNRTQHFENLNYYRKLHMPAHEMLGRFWQIDEAIYEEFLDMLPPIFIVNGFRMSEKLTGDIAATFLKIGAHYWCGYADSKTVVALFYHIQGLLPCEP